MKKLFISIILIASALFSQAHTGYKKLKPIETYTNDSYNLAKGIKYLELREYHNFIDKNKKKIIRKKYKIIAAIKNKKVSKSQINALRKYPPILTKNANIHRYRFCHKSGCTITEGNAFIIDDKNKSWKMDESKDVLTYLGNIDTEAELRLLLWIKSFKYSNSKYKKIKNGYEVISQYKQTIANQGECAIYTFKLKINKLGSISERLINKTKLKHNCIRID